MSMCLTIEVIILASKTEIQLVFSFQFTVGAPVWSAKDFMYLQVALGFLIDLYTYLIFPSVDSENIADWIYTF